MQVRSVSIRNFRGVRALDLRLCRYHALVGENGSGKTAVLEAIDFACSPSYVASRLSEADFNSADAGDIEIRVHFDSYFVAKAPDGYDTKNVVCDGVSLMAKRREKAAPGKALSDGTVVSHTLCSVPYETTAELAADRLPAETSLDSLPAFVRKTTAGLEIERKSGHPMKMRSEALNFALDLVGFPEVFYFDRSREREAKTGFSSLMTRVARDLNWRYRRDLASEATQLLWEAYYRSVISAVEDKKRRDLLVPVRDRAAALLEENLDDLEFSLISLETPFERAFFARRSGLNQIAFDSFGSGVGMVLALCFLEHVSSLSKAPVVFLIDEPELHLHPQLQRRLAGHLRGLAGQVAVSTHSPFFVETGSWDEVSRLARDGAVHPKAAALDASYQGKTLRDHLAEIPKWKQDETVFLDQDRELFFARRVLLVEGPVDRYGLPRIARLLGKDLSTLTVVSCGGKPKIPYYSLLCNAFGIDAFVLFDLDAKPESETENARVLAFTAPLPHHAYEKSFEAELGFAGDYRGNDVLLKVDTLTANEVPPAIAAAVLALEEWMKRTVSVPGGP